MEKKKIDNSSFCFNDLLYFDDLNIQIILKKIEIQLLAKALKDSSEGMQEKFFHNMKNKLPTVQSKMSKEFVRTVTTFRRILNG